MAHALRLCRQWRALDDVFYFPLKVYECVVLFLFFLPTFFRGVSHPVDMRVYVRMNKQYS